MINKQCVVVFPVYKKLSELELAFFENGLQKTENFEHIIVAPKKLIIENSFGKLQSLKVIQFDDKYFENIEGYNKLMLSKEFYTSFYEFEYLLIHQSDVFLFKNDLALWCNKGYDYIGAPWFRPAKLNKGCLFNWVFTKIYQPYLSKNRKNGWLYNKVGNGGLSLRNVKKAVFVLGKCSPLILDKYLNIISPHFNEDVFWAIEAPKLNKDFKIPNWQEALTFAIEFEPKIAFKKNGYKLPFGCHAPLLNDKIFWATYIPPIKKLL